MNYLLLVFVFLFISLCTQVQAAIIFSEGFEEGNALEERIKTLSTSSDEKSVLACNNRNERFFIQDKTTRTGDYAAYFSNDVRENRCELVSKASTKSQFYWGKEYWSGFSFNIPFVKKNGWNVYHQHFSQLGEYGKDENCEYGGNGFTILREGKAEKEELAIYLRSAGNLVPDSESGSVISGAEAVYRWPLKLNEWNDIVLNFRYSANNNGFFRVWHNGNLVVDVSGSNVTVIDKAYDSEHSLSPSGVCGNLLASYYTQSVGIYAGNEGVGAVYYDDLRIGDASSSYAAVSPADQVKVNKAQGNLKQKNTRPEFRDEIAYVDLNNAYSARISENFVTPSQSSASEKTIDDIEKIQVTGLNRPVIQIVEEMTRHEHVYHRVRLADSLFMKTSIWQISDEPSFETLLLSKQLEESSEFVIPLGVLSIGYESPSYWVRVRYFDDLGRSSDWSNSFLFTVDVDNLLDERYQINEDDEIYKNSEFVASDEACQLLDAENFSIINLSSSDGVIDCHSAYSKRQFGYFYNSKSDEILPYGLFNFKISGLDIDVDFPSEVIVNFNFPEMPRVDGHWASYDESLLKVFSATDLLEIDENSITLTLTDGGKHDVDGVVNGVIIHTGGPTSKQGQERILANPIVAGGEALGLALLMSLIFFRLYKTRKNKINSI